MALTYFFLLPSLASFRPTSIFSNSDTPYAAIPTLDDDATSDTSSLADDDQVLQRVEHQLDKLPGLTTREKFELAKPLFVRFMLPLFFVYMAGKSSFLAHEGDYLWNCKCRIHDQLWSRSYSALRDSQTFRITSSFSDDQELTRLLPVRLNPTLSSHDDLAS